jgi:hypothetical protein
MAFEITGTIRYIVNNGFFGDEKQYIKNTLVLDYKRQNHKGKTVDDVAAIEAFSHKDRAFWRNQFQSLAPGWEIKVMFDITSTKSKRGESYFTTLKPISIEVIDRGVEEQTTFTEQEIRNENSEDILADDELDDLPF